MSSGLNANCASECDCVENDEQAASAYEFIVLFNIPFFPFQITCAVDVHVRGIRLARELGLDFKTEIDSMM